MFGKKDLKNFSFSSVGMALIMLGAAIFAFGVVGWFYNYFGQTLVVAIPSAKVIGGAIITALGYVIIELEIIRKE